MAKITDVIYEYTWVAQLYNDQYTGKFYIPHKHKNRPVKVRQAISVTHFILCSYPVV